LSLNANSNSIKNENIRSYSIIKDDNNNNYNNEILDLERKITLAKGQEKVDLVIKNTRIVNVFSGEIHQTDVAIADGIFVGFRRGGYNTKNLYDIQR
jgi:adenine deaminase